MCGRISCVSEQFLCLQMETFCVLKMKQILMSPISSSSSASSSSFCCTENNATLIRREHKPVYLRMRRGGALRQPTGCQRYCILSKKCHAIHITLGLYDLYSLRCSSWNLLSKFSPVDEAYFLTLDEACVSVEVCDYQKACACTNQAQTLGGGG